MISEAIKEREKFILTKNSTEIAIDSRIVAAFNSSSMLSSKFNLKYIFIAQKVEVIYFYEIKRRKNPWKDLIK